MTDQVCSMQRTSENVLPDISVINHSELENRQLKGFQE